MNTYVFWLSLIVFLPTLGAVVIACLPKARVELLRYVALVTTAATFVISLGGTAVARGPTGVSTRTWGRCRTRLC